VLLADQQRHQEGGTVETDQQQNGGGSRELKKICLLHLGSPCSFAARRLASCMPPNAVSAVCDGRRSSHGVPKHPTIEERRDRKPARPGRDLPGAWPNGFETQHKGAALPQRVGVRS